MQIHIYVFVTALLCAVLTVPILRKWALNYGTLDHPGERKVHRGAIPRLGGVSIFLGCILALLVFADISTPIYGIMAGATVLFVTGLIDDLVGISPRKKFLGEILGVAATIAIGNLYITDLGNLFGLGDILLPLWLALPFTVFAVVGVINAINLIDGLDGLSGGVSVIALSAFMLLGYLDGNYEVTLICAALIGAVLGFLKYNSHPACIFMGDAGSLVLGFILAFLSIHLTQAPGAKVQAVLPLVILSVPIIDAVWVMGRRIYSGVSPFRADMTHLHHKFLALGFSHRLSVRAICGIALFWATVAVGMRDVAAWQLFALLVVATIAFYRLLHWKTSHENYPDAPVVEEDTLAGAA